MSQSLVSKLTTKIATEIESKLCPKHIRFAPESLTNCMQWFYEKYKIPPVLGCIDGFHIGLQKPTENEHTFFNRNGFHSLSVMIVWLDYKLKLKRKVSTNRRETVATGGGPYAQQSLSPLEQAVDELLHLQEAANPTGSPFGTSIVEDTPTTMSEEQASEVRTEGMDPEPRSSTSRSRITIDEREGKRLKALEKQGEVQDTLCEVVSKMEKKIEEIARYARKSHELKKEEVELLRRKEERRKEENFEKKKQHKEKVELKLKELELKALKYKLK